LSAGQSEVAQALGWVLQQDLYHDDPRLSGNPNLVLKIGVACEKPSTSLTLNAAACKHVI